LPSFLAIFLLFVLAHVHYPTLAKPGQYIEIDQKSVDEFVAKQRDKRRANDKAGRNVFPVETANIFSQLWFGWMTPLVKLGAKRPLQADDVWQLPAKDCSDQVDQKFAKAWLDQKNSV
jgi:ATP-binding cassette subfamily C (CFTR/MRP) protein 1